MSHVLVDIPHLEWKKLRDLYDPYKKEAAAYSLLENYIKWTEKQPTFQTKIYALDDDWESDGTFILIDPDMSVTFLYFNTLNDDLKQLQIALDLLDKKLDYLVFAVPERILPALKFHLNNETKTANDIQIEFDVWYYLKRETARNFEIKPPRGITLTNLKLEHAEKINRLWLHFGPGTINYVKRLISLNDNVGAFDEFGNLVAWCLRTPVGALGLFQVSAQHRRQGLGALVVRYMAQCIAKKNEEVFAPVSLDNIASRALFEKLGFQAIDKVYWAMKPAN